MGDSEDRKLNLKDRKINEKSSTRSGTNSSVGFDWLWFDLLPASRLFLAWDIFRPEDLAECSSETSADLQRTARHYIWQGRLLQGIWFLFIRRISKFRMLQEGVSRNVNASPVIGRGGPLGCETSRLKHFLDNRLPDGDEVNLTHRLHFIARKIHGTHFC
jgi:hypothetical protein